MLNATIRHHCLQSNYDPKFVDEFLRSLYVDDLTSGVATFEEGCFLYKNTKRLMSYEGFILRKWVTNDKNLQNFIDANEDTSEKSFENSTLRNIKKVLGILWDVDIYG